jgi:shikimate dehydrogenase
MSADPFDWRRPAPGRAYAEVIGDPISQSKSPKIHNFWLGKLGIDADYRAAHVTPDELADYLAARRADPLWRGCNVTMPHKQAVMALVDRLDPLAERVGAVNTVVPGADGMLTGYNTDVPGFLEPLRPLLDETHYFRMARVLGTGGAARAIVTALAEEKLVIVLAGRNPDKARALLDELDAPGDNHGAEHHAADLAHFADATDFSFDDREQCLDLVVNASSLGMTGQPALAFDLSHAPPGSVFYDIVTSPLDTAFLQAARAAGFRTVDGLAMLIGQADHAFRRFFGATPPRGEADAELRARIMA